MPSDLAARPHAIAVGGGWLWVAAADEVLQLDLATGRVVGRNRLDGRGWPAFASGRLVVADESGNVSLITPVLP